jgi:hypothetical protein
LKLGLLISIALGVLVAVVLEPRTPNKRFVTHTQAKA